MASPSTVLHVVAVAAPCDPALDLEHADAPRLLSAYERSRSPEDLAALPVLPGETLTRYALAPLTTVGYAAAKDVQGDAQRALFVVSVCCHSYTDARGTHTARTQKAGRLTVADDEWLDELSESGGAQVLAELASVALRRAEVRPTALDPFALPRGMRLAR
jgi:hypothetical protein